MRTTELQKHLDNSFVTNDINDILRILPPKQREFLKQIYSINTKEGRPVAVVDFPHLSKVNYRQLIRKTGRFLELVINSKPKFWKVKGIKFPGDWRKITYDPTSLGSNFEQILDLLKVQKPHIHDIKIQFSCSQLYQNLLKKGCNPHPNNKSIRIPIPIADDNVTLKALVYPKTTQIDIGCSYKPIPFDISGIIAMTYFLSIASYHLAQFSLTFSIPPVSEWLVTHYHFNKDGTELSGPRFEVKLNEMASGFTRFYLKKMKDGKSVPRIERVITPKKPLSVLLEESLYSDNK